MRVLLLIILIFATAGCADYELKNLAKSDVDLVADEFIDETRHLVRELTDNLSFERLFGKTIILQEMMARIAGDARDRHVTTAARGRLGIYPPADLSHSPAALLGYIASCRRWENRRGN